MIYIVFIKIRGDEVLTLNHDHAPLWGGGFEGQKVSDIILKDLVEMEKMLKTASKILFLARVMVCWKSRFAWLQYAKKS